MASNGFNGGGYMGYRGTYMHAMHSYGYNDCNSMHSNGGYMNYSYPCGYNDGYYMNNNFGFMHNVNSYANVEGDFIVTQGEDIHDGNS